MAVNLLDLAKNYLSDNVVGQVSNMLGESQSNTQKALDGSLPVILSGLIQKAGEPGGAGSIMDMVGEVMTPNPATGDVFMPTGGILGQLGNLVSNKDQSGSLLSMGSGIIQSIFGAKAGAISTAISSYSGIKESSASSLMSLAGPVLLSAVGTKLAEAGSGVSGLGSLLSSQASAVQSALPSELASLLSSIPGLGMLGGLAGKAGDLLGSTVSKPTMPPVPPVPSFTNSETRESGGGNRWLPWLLLALGAAALFYFLRSCNGEKAASSTTTESTTMTTDSSTSGMSTADSVGSKVGAAVDSAGSALSNATSGLGTLFKRKLPSGVELNIPENGIESNIVKFIEDKNKPVDKTTWFNFRRLVFDTGKATLKPESKEEVKNMAEILKAFPAVEIKIGGYTDNTGSATLNKQLSQKRADVVMNELVQMNIAKSRLAAEGYGPEHPIASNETAAGRAENRRIAVRVTKK